MMATIDPNAELFDAPDSSNTGSSMPSSPPPPPPTQDDTSAGSSGGGGGGGTLHLSVTDPQLVGEGRNAHTFYRIDVRPNQYADTIASVRRRYSDFRWLFNRLHEERGGAIIPIIPHIKAFQLDKRLGEELIEERRVQCEKFLRRVQVHPELEGAPSISAFFSPDAEVFEQAKKDHPETEVEESNNSAKEKVKHFFVKAGIKAKVARGGMEQLEETPDAAQMEEVEQYLSTLETHIKALTKATLYLVDVSKETSTNMHELGQTLFGLQQTYDPDAMQTTSNGGQSDNNSETKSKYPSLKTISNVFASLSAINKVKHDENFLKVSDPIHDLQDKIKGARLALKRRKDHAITYNTFLQQIKNRQATLEKLNQKNATSPQSQTEHQIVTTQQLLDESNKSSKLALAALEKVTQRVFREMDRFKHTVDSDLRMIYVNHARVQVDYSRQLDAEWNKILPNGNVGGGGGAGSAGEVGGVDDDGVLSKEAEMMMI
jgi:sorting nexin-1/2